MHAAKDLFDSVCQYADVLYASNVLERMHTIIRVSLHIMCHQE